MELKGFCGVSGVASLRALQGIAAGSVAWPAHASQFQSMGETAAEGAPSMPGQAPGGLCVECSSSNLTKECSPGSYTGAEQVSSMGSCLSAPDLLELCV